jgi:hypothetical protein
MERRSTAVLPEGGDAVRRPHFWLVATGFWLLLIFSTGCSGTIYPPPHPIEPVTAYVADYGRHSSIVLPAKNGGYIEWAFGDWNWFALGHTKWNDALLAILWSPQSTLGRRVVGPQPNDEALRHALNTNRVTPIEVSADSATALMDQLDKRYLRHAQTQVYSSYSYMDHVKDCEYYSALHNCNHLTARWLRKLGCRVDGLAFGSGFKLAK